MSNKRRTENFTNDTQYKFDYLSLSLGIGAIWRFPYAIQHNGGGTFLIPYILFVFLFAVSLTYYDMSLGQYFRLPLLEIYKQHNRKWQGIAISHVIINFFLCVYQTITMAWNILFMLTCCQSNLPWNNANSKYGNTEQTILSRINKYFHDEIVYNIKDINEISYTGFYLPLVVCFLLCWIIIYLSLYLGFNKSRKLMYGTMIYVIAFLIFALTRVLFQPNAFDGLKYLITVDFTKLQNLKIWIEAAEQVFFQFSLGMGFGQTFSSFRKVDSKNRMIAILGPITNFFQGALSAITVFGYLGNYIAETSTIQNFSDLQYLDQDLIYTVYPAIMNKLPGSNVFLMLFFFGTFLLAKNVAYGSAQIVCFFIRDKNYQFDNKKLNWKYILFIVVLAEFQFGLLLCGEGGFYIFQVMDDYLLQLPMAVTNFMTIFVFFYKTNYKNMFTQLCHVTQEGILNVTLNIIKWLNFYILQILIIVFLIFDYIRQTGKYTQGLNILGNFMLLSSILPILIYRIRYRKSPSQYNPYTLKLDQIKVNENRSRGSFSSTDNIEFDDNSMEMYLLNEFEDEKDQKETDKYMKLNKQISKINKQTDDNKNVLLSESSFASFEFEKMDQTENSNRIKYDDVFQLPRNSQNSIAFIVNHTTKDAGDSDFHYNPVEMNSLHKPIIFNSKVNNKDD